VSEINLTQHKLLASWAADCAEHVLPVFEKEEADDRSRKAIEASRAWVRGDITITEARKFAFAAHAAAREAKSAEATAAARSAGHAAATAHVHTHAKHAAAYALKAVKDQKAEREWQMERAKLLGIDLVSLSQ